MQEEVIELKQLPIIVEKLDTLSSQVKNKVDMALSLVCSEETVKEVKKARADLTREFNELETERKNIKNAIMEKYNEFEKVYSLKVGDIYKNADIELKAKIDNVENDLKSQKEEELRLFAQEQINYYHLESIITYESLDIKVTLSASMKSLKENICSKVEKIVVDISSLGEQEHKEEMLYEYLNNGFILGSAILSVKERYRKIEELKNNNEQVDKKLEEEQKIEQKVEEVIAPKVILEEEEILTVQFTIKDTKTNIKKVKQFLIDNGIKYE